MMADKGGAQFSAKVDAFVAQSQARLLAVFKESAQRTISLAQAGIPVDTGFARASLVVSTEAMPEINRGARPREGQSYGFAASYGAIGSVKMGGQIFAGWTASYVEFLEHGSSKQAPQGFVRLAALQWPQTVATVAAELKGRVGG